MDSRQTVSLIIQFLSLILISFSVKDQMHLPWAAFRSEMTPPKRKSRRRMRRRRL